jgi:hypothetical protein
MSRSIAELLSFNTHEDTLLVFQARPALYGPVRLQALCHHRSAARDEATGKWLPIVSVSWARSDNNRRGLHVLTASLERFATFQATE